MSSDAQFGEAFGALFRELGWTHGELTPSLVHQALAQVRHLRKEAERLEVAADAIAYTLRRFQTDAEFAYHMWHTETLNKLVRAYAAIKGLDPAVVRAEIEADAKELPQARCSADKEFLDGGPSV